MVMGVEGIGRKEDRRDVEGRREGGLRELTAVLITAQ